MFTAPGETGEEIDLPDSDVEVLDSSCEKPAAMAEGKWAEEMAALEPPDGEPLVYVRLLLCVLVFAYSCLHIRVGIFVVHILHSYLRIPMLHTVSEILEYANTNM